MAVKLKEKAKLANGIFFSLFATRQFCYVSHTVPYYSLAFWERIPLGENPKPLGPVRKVR